jgi:hypothetical protein
MVCHELLREQMRDTYGDIVVSCARFADNRNFHPKRF